MVFLGDFRVFWGPFFLKQRFWEFGRPPPGVVGWRPLTFAFVMSLHNIHSNVFWRVLWHQKTHLHYFPVGLHKFHPTAPHRTFENCIMVVKQEACKPRGCASSKFCQVTESAGKILEMLAGQSICIGLGNSSPDFFGSCLPLSTKCISSLNQSYLQKESGRNGQW